MLSELELKPKLVAKHVGSGAGRVVVDFDDTLVEAKWPAIGAWKPGAVEALHTLLAAGAEVVVSSTRLAPTEVDEETPRDPEEMAAELATIRQMFDDEGLHEVKLWTRPWKPGAVAYVDDKAVTYNGNNDAWAVLTAYLLEVLR